MTRAIRYLGPWGALGSMPQKGIVHYGISANRQNPLAGTFNAAIFNTWRRFRSQVFYVAPPFVALYFIIDYAERRNKYLNSKAGRREYADVE